MHTNSAVQTVTRLIDIGVPAFLVAPAMIGAMGQRLVRRICANCKEAYLPPPEIVEAMFEDKGKDDVVFYHGTGCLHCANTGYRGRLRIYEVYLMTDAVRHLITRADLIRFCPFAVTPHGIFG